MSLVTVSLKPEAVADEIAFLVGRGMIRYGDLIEHAAMRRMCGLANDDDNYALFRLQVIEHVLVKHRLMLRSERGEGFRLLHPREQTDAAIEIMYDGIQREMRMCRRRMKYIREAELTAAELSDNALKRATVGGLAAIIRHKKGQISA